MPKAVSGNESPYPTLVSETKVNQNEAGIDVKVHAPSVYEYGTRHRTSSSSDAASGSAGQPEALRAAAAIAGPSASNEWIMHAMKTPRMPR